MRIPNRNTKLGMFLFQSGVLNAEDESAIKEKMREYYRTYDRALKQKKRKIEKRTFSISFAPSDIQHVRKRAKQRQVETIDYIKLLVIADITDTSFIENTMTFKQILQILQYYKNAIKEIEEKDETKWMGANKNYEALSATIRAVETSIRDLIKQRP